MSINEPGLSAAEKARNLREQQLQKRQEIEVNKTQNVQQEYESSKTELDSLKLKREELVGEISVAQNTRSEKISSQRTAVKELVSLPETYEMMRKDEDGFKQGVFGEDEEALSAARQEQKKLEKGLKVMDEQLKTLKNRTQELYRLTPEGVEAEKQRLIQEQEKKKTFVNDTFKRSFSHDSMRELGDAGTFRINDVEMKVAVDELGLEEAKNVLNEVLGEKVDGMIKHQKEGMKIQNEIYFADLEKTFLQIDENKKEMPNVEQEMEDAERELKSASRQLAEFLENHKNDPKVSRVISDWGLMKHPKTFFATADFEYDPNNTLESMRKFNAGYYNQVYLPNAKDAREAIASQKELINERLSILKEGPEKFAEYFRPLSSDRIDNAYTRTKVREKMKQQYVLGSSIENLAKKNGGLERVEAIYKEKKQLFDSKEAALKECAKNVVEMEGFEFETREKFGKDIFKVENEVKDDGYKKQSASADLEKVIKKQIEKSAHLDEEISLDGQSIHFPKFEKMYKDARSEVVNFEGQVKNLSLQKSKLEDEIQKATFGIGNGKRKEQLTEIESSIKDLNVKITEKSNEAKAASNTYPGVDSIFREAYLKPSDFFKPRMTLRGLLEVMNQDFKAKAEVPPDQDKVAAVKQLESLRKKSEEKRKAYSVITSEERKIAELERQRR